MNWWKQVLALVNPFGPRVQYSENGRSGYVRYADSRTSFDMYWEFGGSTVLAIVDVPVADDWTAHTKLPLAERDSVLRFIAERIIRDKTASPHRYEIDADSIRIIAKGR